MARDAPFRRSLGGRKFYRPAAKPCLLPPEDTMTNHRLVLPTLAAAVVLAGCDHTDPVAAPLFKQAGAGAQEVTGEIGPGAPYRLGRPDPWNGNLVVYAHGYQDPAGDPELPNLPLIDAMLASGFGVAYSAYSESGFAVKDGRTRSRQLRGLFASRLGNPKGTYLMGHSLGGAIVLSLAEDNPGAFDGALPACGLLGGSPMEVAYILNVRILFDYFFPGVLPGDALNVPPGLTFPPLIPAIVGALSTNFFAAVEMAGVDQVEILWTTPAELVEAIVTALGFQIIGASDLIERGHGHSPFDNTHTLYSGSANDAALNAGVDRFSSTPDAEKYLEHWFQPTGRLAIPVLTLHTTRDPVVPFVHEPTYAAIAAAAGSSDLLVQRPVARFGHCRFTVAEQMAALNDLVTWVETGVTPAP